MTEETNTNGNISNDPLYDEDYIAYAQNIKNNSIKLIKTIIKQSDEKWFINFNKDRLLLNRYSDSRDDSLEIEPQHIDLIKEWRKLNRYPLGTMIAFDREYVDENTIKVYYYFISVSTALNFYRDHRSNSLTSDSVIKKRHSKMLLYYKEKYKIPEYEVIWNLIDQNGTDITEKIYSTIF